MSNIIDKLAWIHIQENKLLVTRTHDRSTFYIPGGERQDGESDQAALSRGIREELSVGINTESMKSAGTFCAQAHGETGNVQVQLNCYFAEHEGDITPSAEVAESQFVGYQDLSTCSAATILLMHWLHEQGLIR